MTTQVPETKSVNRLRVPCDGGGPAYGHPRVWLEIAPAKGWVECPYCDARYVYEPEKPDSGH